MSRLDRALSALAWGICLFAEQARADSPRPVWPLDSLYFVVEQNDPPYTLRTFYIKAPPDQEYGVFQPWALRQKYDVFIQWVLRTDVFSGFHLYGPRHENKLRSMLTESKQGSNGMALIIRLPQHLRILEDIGPELLSEADPLLLMISTSTNLNKGRVMASLKESGVLQDPAHLAEIEEAWPLGEIRLEEGDRSIAVVLPAEKFSDSKMGGTEKVTPKKDNLDLYKEQFALLYWLFRRETSTLPVAAALTEQRE